MKIDEKGILERVIVSSFISEMAENVDYGVIKPYLASVATTVLMGDAEMVKNMDFALHSAQKFAVENGLSDSETERKFKNALIEMEILKKEVMQRVTNEN